MPILAIMTFNVVVFVCVIVVLIRHVKNQAERTKEAISAGTVIRLIVSISGVMFLFGLTWLFAILTFSVDSVPVLRKVFASFFTIFNSFQGVFIFVFVFVLNKEAIESWKELLSRGSYQSRHLPHPPRVDNLVTKNKTNSTGVVTSQNSTGQYSSDMSKSSYESKFISSEKFDPVKDADGVIPLNSIANGNEFDNNKEIESTSISNALSDLLSPGSDQSSKDNDDNVLIITQAVDKQAGAFPQNDEVSTDTKEKAKGVDRVSTSSGDRVKRISTKKGSKYEVQVEVVEVDFRYDESDEDVAETETLDL